MKTRDPANDDKVNGKLYEQPRTANCLRYCMEHVSEDPGHVCPFVNHNRSRGNASTTYSVYMTKRSVADTTNRRDDSDRPKDPQGPPNDPLVCSNPSLGTLLGPSLGPWLRPSLGPLLGQSLAPTLGPCWALPSGPCWADLLPGPRWALPLGSL